MEGHNGKIPTQAEKSGASSHAPTYQADLIAALGPIRSREAMNAELAEMATDS